MFKKNVLYYNMPHKNVLFVCNMDDRSNNDIKYILDKFDGNLNKVIQIRVDDIYTLNDTYDFIFVI